MVEMHPVSTPCSGKEHSIQFPVLPEHNFSIQVTGLHVVCQVVINASN